MYSMDQTQQASFGGGVQQLNQNQNFGISSIPSNQSQRSQPKAPVAINASPQIQQRALNPTNQFQASLVQRLPNLPTLPRLPNLPTLPRLPNLPATAALTGQARAQAASQTGIQAGAQAGSQAGRQAASQTGSQGAGNQAGGQAGGQGGRQAGGQAGGQAGDQAAVAAQNRKQQLKQQRQEAKNQSLQLPQVKSVGDYIARRNRMVMGGNTCSHEYRFLTQMLQEVDFIKRLYAQQVPLSISEVFIWKTTRMEVAHNLVTKYESFSDIVIYVIYVIYVICVICVIYLVDVIFFYICRIYCYFLTKF